MKQITPEEMIEALNQKYGEDAEYDVGGLLKVIAAFTARCMSEEGETSADITEVIYGEGFKFTFHVTAERWGD